MNSTIQAAVDIAALVEENEELHGIIGLLREYDQHRRKCTPCACGIHCPIEAQQWAEIRKRLYSLDGGE
jgi:hypothetical protein